MQNKHVMTRLVALTFAMIATSLSALAGWVYYDNSVTGWTTPTVYYWGGSSEAGWPGAPMAQDSGFSHIWKYQVPDGTTKIIFSGGGDNAGKTQTEDLDYVTDHVYIKETANYNEDGQSKGGRDTRKTYAEYTGSEPDPDPDPGELTDYRIYFNNNVGWANVYVTIMGNVSGQSNGGVMVADLNGSIHDISFKAPENARLTCYFYCNTDFNGTKTATFNLINGHIYTRSGDKGPKEDYDPTHELPEAEWWYEPANPSQNDVVTVYFNPRYEASSALKNINDIYMWTGVVITGNGAVDSNGDEIWYGSLPDWNFDQCDQNKVENYKMTLSDKYEGVYTYSYSPNVAAWANLDVDQRASKIGIIFRNKSGNIKQHNDNQYIQLRALPAPGAGLGKFQNCLTTLDETTGLSTVEIEGERGSLFITPMSEDVIKIFTRKNGQTKAERESISVVDPSGDDYLLEKPNSVTVTGDNQESATVLSLQVNGKTKLEVSKENCLVTFLNDNEEVALAELNGLVNTIGNIEVSFQGMDDAGFYGGGYNGNYVNQDGKEMPMNNTQTGGWAQNYKGAPHNICIPFYASTEGYGVYFDDHTRGARIYPSRNGSSYSSASQNPIAYYYVGGGTMQKVLENYTRLTGTPELPAYWSLGYITSKYSFRTRQAAEEVISKTRGSDCNIPLDGIVFDIHWQGGPNMMGKIDWDTSNYNNPVEMMENFRSQYGVHSIAITEPYFTGSSGNFKTEYFADSSVSNMDWLGNGSNVGLLDITNQDANEWYKGLYKARTREGIDSWWLDLGEPEQHDGDSRYSDKSSVDQIHNEYGLRWLKVAYDAMKELDAENNTATRRIFLPRAGTSGMQRYNACPWTGDIKRSWSGLAAQVPALVSAAMSGVSTLGSDIGGFSEPDNYNSNIYRRWVQLGVFYPMMRTHAQDQLSPGPEPYAHGSVLSDVRDAINLRYAYLPYSYSQSYQYTANGTPIARPANFSDSDKSRLANSIDTYYWGPDLYVAPMLWEGTSRDIALPEGNWLDATDFKTIYRGGGSISYDVPYNKIPRFMREGSFLTRYRESAFTNTASIQTDKVTVDYFLNYEDYNNNPDWYGDNSEGSVWYDDDHQTVNPLRDKKYLLTRFHGHGHITGGTHVAVIYIDREGEGWDGMYSRADGENRHTRNEDSDYNGEQYDGQDMLLAIHNFNCSGNNANDLQVNFHDYGPRKNAAQDAETARYGLTAADNEEDIDTKKIWPKVYGMKSMSAEDLANATTFENGRLKDTATEGYYLDRNSNTLYVRMPKLDPMRSYAMLIGNNGQVVGVNDVNLASMTLGYGNGYFTYSAPEGTESLGLAVYSTTGACVAQFDGLNADGHASQVAVTLPQGVYIGRLTGRDATGATATRTVKVVVR